MKPAKRQIWRRRATKVEHIVIEAYPDHILTSSDKEGFLGPVEQFLHEFDYVDDDPSLACALRPVPPLRPDAQAKEPMAVET